MLKKTVVVLFGGCTAEHDKSLTYAAKVIDVLDTEKYYVFPIGITRDGRWLLYNGSTANILSGEWEKFGSPAIISPDMTHSGILKISGDKAKIIPIDMVIPLIFRKGGKAKDIEGLLKLARIPFVQIYEFEVCEDSQKLDSLIRWDGQNG